MKKIRAVIVDDEGPARRRLRKLLQQQDRIQIVAECSSGNEAVRIIRRTSPDLLFLDIRMPEKDGFEVLEEISSAPPPMVIFVTAFDQYAVRAFEMNALDYLLKPFDSQRFRNTLQRVFRQSQGLPALDRRLRALLQNLTQPAGVESDESGSSNYLNRLTIKSSERIFFVKSGEIDWIQAAGKYVEVHVGKKTHLLRQSIGSLALQLNPEIFLRIHRSFIVNLDRVKELQRWSGSEYLFVLEDGTRLQSSRGYVSSIQDCLKI